MTESLALPGIESFGVGNATIGLHACCRIGIAMGTENSIDPFGQINENAVERLEECHGAESPLISLIWL